jgi:hypothetical protein
MNKNKTKKILYFGLSRFLIGLVLIINVQCAVWFLINPTYYAPFYELTGIPGETAIQGFGILFLMWNVPYALAAYHPIKFQISLFEAVLMQSIGVLGETKIFLGLPTGYPILKSAIKRFIVFDGMGLILLIIASYMTIKMTRDNNA